MDNGYSRFVAQLDEAIASFPGLIRMTIGNQEVLKGVLSVIDIEGKLWEEYDVEIHASEMFPYEFPILFEVSGKIPRIADWHIYEDTGSCCVKVRPEELIKCRNGLLLTEYIAGEVMPFLFNQTHRRVEGYYVNGEYAHGIAGIYQFYSTILKTGENVLETIRLMKFISENERPIRTSYCFCGKNSKFRNCHKEAFDYLKLSEAGRLKQDVSLFKKFAFSIK